MTVEKNPCKLYNRSYRPLSNLVRKIYYGQPILSHDFLADEITNLWCDTCMALDAFILPDYFSIKEVNSPVWLLVFLISQRGCP